jgi:hypothetical protein
LTFLFILIVEVVDDVLDAPPCLPCNNGLKLGGAQHPKTITERDFWLPALYLFCWDFPPLEYLDSNTTVNQQREENYFFTLSEGKKNLAIANT